MKSLFWRVVVTAFLSLLLAPKAHATEQTAAPVGTDVYELRVYFNEFFHDTDKPEIETQIKVGSLFFATNAAPMLPPRAGDGPPKQSPILYVVSGILHPQKDRKFPLDWTFFRWSSPQNNVTYGPNTDYFELGKEQGHYWSDGIVNGYTATLTKVTPPAELAPKQGETPPATQPTTSRP